MRGVPAADGVLVAVVTANRSVLCSGARSAMPTWQNAVRRVRFTHFTWRLLSVAHLLEPIEPSEQCNNSNVLSSLYFVDQSISKARLSQPAWQTSPLGMFPGVGQVLEVLVELAPSPCRSTSMAAFPDLARAGTGASRFPATRTTYRRLWVCQQRHRGYSSSRPHSMSSFFVGSNPFSS